MRKIICVILCPVIFFAGCAGRDPHPVPLYIPGDENRNCESLKTEVVQLQKDMGALLPKTDKFGTNALWATAGVFLIVPFFFMDMKDAEKVEFEAMRQRHNRLLTYIETKNCDVNDITAKPIPSLEQQRKAAEEQLKQQKEDAKKKQTKEQNNAPSTSNMTVIKCEKCGHEIGKLEKAYVKEGRIVCSQCYLK